MIRRIVVLSVVAALALWLGLRMAERAEEVGPAALPPGADAFVRAEGRQLARAGVPFVFRAVGFGNFYSLRIGEYGFAPETSRYHSERDFERVAALGFNSIRFAINGTWYRDDPRGFWRWLDRNVGWARAHGLLLVLDLHVPIGGDWLDASAGPGDFGLWTDPALRAANVDFWRAVAARYRDEPAIGAYDILNEPVTLDETGDQWRRLAGEMVAAIRAEDPNHLVIVGPVYGTGGAYEPLAPAAQFLVDDDNVMYDFHFYDPIAFTHQTAGWLARPILDGGRYPDPARVIPTGAEVLLDAVEIAAPRLPPGDSGWRRYESAWVEITDPRAVAALPVATLRDGARGAVGFDAIEVFEHDPARDAVSRVVDAPLGPGALGDWWDWRGADRGVETGHGGARFARVTTDGANDSASLEIAGRTGAGDFLGWSSDAHWIRVTPGNSYRIVGHMRASDLRYEGADDRLGGAGFAGLALDVYADPPGGAGPGFVSRGKELLALRFDALARFGARHDVPMSVMEFGTIRASVETPGKGGAVWVADMLDLFAARGVSFSLWNYLGPSMGLYLGDEGSARARPNRALIDTVRAGLASSGPEAQGP